MWSDTNQIIQNFLIFTITNLLIYLSSYGTPRTGRTQQCSYSTNHKWHKQGAAKLLKLHDKYLLMVTVEYLAKTIQFKLKWTKLFAQQYNIMKPDLSSTYAAHSTEDMSTGEMRGFETSPSLTDNFKSVTVARSALNVRVLKCQKL